MCGGELFRQTGAADVVGGAEDFFDLAGDLGELGDEVERLGVGDGAADLREVQREGEERGELGSKGFRRSHSDFRAGVGGDGSGGEARDGGADDVADGEGLGAFGDELVLRGDGVGGFAGLGDEQAEVGGVRDGVAVAVFAGVVDVDGEAREALDHELAGEPGVPRGAAGGDGDAGGVAEVVVGEGHVGEEDAAGVEGDAAEGGVADGAWLLVDFLEHEVLVAGFFGLDGVPGDALGFEGAGCAFEVGEDDAGGGEGGDFAVLQEVNVPGVVEDAGDVGGEEVFAVADAEDGGRAEARGDHLVGLGGGEHADGEGSGEALDRAAHGFFERDDVWDALAGDGFVGVGVDGAGREVGVGCGRSRSSAFGEG